MSIAPQGGAGQVGKKKGAGSKMSKELAKAGKSGYRGTGGAMRLLGQTVGMRNAEANPGPPGVVGQNPMTIGRGMLAKQLGLGPYRPIAAGPRQPMQAPGLGATLGLGAPATATGVAGAPAPMVGKPTKARLY